MSSYLLLAFSQRGGLQTRYTYSCMGFAAEVSLVASLDSKQACKYVVFAHLGIFSVDELTFEQLLRAAAPRTACQRLSGTLPPGFLQVLCVCLLEKVEEDRGGVVKEGKQRRGDEVRRKETG